MNLTAAILLAAGAALLLWSVKRINPGALALSAVTGLASLFAADLLMGFTRGNLPINGFTVSCAALGGVPGVALLILLKTLFGI